MWTAFLGKRRDCLQSFLPSGDFEVLAGDAGETAGGLVCRAQPPLPHNLS